MPKPYRLSRLALRDLDDITQYTAERWGRDQAHAYIDLIFDSIGTITQFPDIAPLRHDVAPPVRMLQSQRHLIIYRVETQHIQIVAIKHYRQDWQSLLKS